MNKTLAGALKYALFVCIGGGLLYLAFRGNDPAKMLQDLKRANYYWVVAGMACGYLAFILRGLRWKLLLQPAGYQPNTWNSIHSVSIGYLANLAVPRLGEVTRCTVMNRADNIPVDTLFGTVLAERVIDLLMLGGCLILTLFLKLDSLLQLIDKSGIGEKFQGISWLLYILGAILTMTLGFFLFRKFKSRLLKLPLVPKIVAFLAGVVDGFNTVIRLDKRMQFVAYTIGIWVLYFLMSYLYFFCLEETYGLTLADGIFVMLAGSLGIIAPAPGGIGAFHAAVIAGLVTLGIEKDAAGTLAIIVHSSQTLMTLFAGSLALILLSLGRKKAQHAILQ